MGLQVWILICFEHSDEPLGYSTYFMSSFMSHSCFPNAVWHYEGDYFVLRARYDIVAHDEVSVSYLSEESLLESVPARRKHLKDSKHFVCECQRCNALTDRGRGFRCPQCQKAIFPGMDPRPESFVGIQCDCCLHAISAGEAHDFGAQESELETHLDAWEERSGGKRTMQLGTLEETVARAEQSLSQHWLLDKAWQVLADGYDRYGRPQDAEAAMKKRIAFQEGAYPGLSGTHAWTLEAFADMLLRHSGGTTDPQVHLRSEDAAKQLIGAPAVYGEALRILGFMFGEDHAYYTTVHRKRVELDAELRRLLGVPGDVA